MEAGLGNDGCLNHAYDHNTTDTTRNYHYFRTYSSSYVRELFRYDIVAGKWENLPSIPTSLPAPSQTTVLKYFPEMDGLVLVSNSQSPATVLFFDLKTQQWRLLAKDLPIGGLHPIGQYNPVHKVVIFGGGNDNSDLYKLDSTGTVTKLKNVPPEIPFRISGSTGITLTVDPVSGKYLALTQTQLFYEYDVITDTWKLLNITPPISATHTVATPVGRHGVMMFINNGGLGTKSKVYLYKHASGGGIPVPSDTTPPTVPGNLTAFVISSSQINLSWSASTDNVEVAGYRVYRNNSQIATTQATSYSDTAVSPGTTYTYAVAAYDAAGNISNKSASVSATSQSPSPDTIPPTVSITFPASNANVSGSITVSANASDNVGVSGVQFKLDGNNLGAEDTTSPYSTSWNTTSVANGSHTLTATARDAAGNRTTSTAVTVTVNNTTSDTTAPIISTVKAISITTSAATITWTTNEAADTQIEYGLTTTYGKATPLDGTLTFSHSQVLSGLTPNTLYHYKVKSKDMAGNLAASGDFTFTTLTALATPTPTPTPPQPPVTSLSVGLTIQEPAGIARTNESITSGIPLPPGTQTTNWSLWDGTTEIPVQITKLQGRTPWILLDFQTSIPGNGAKILTLKDVPSSKTPSQSITISEDTNQIMVTTGPLKTTLSKTNFNLFNAIWFDRNNDGTFASSEQVITPSSGDNIQIVDTTTGQTFFGRGVPDKVTWEYQGKLRSTLRVDGRYRNTTSGQEFITYTMRISFFAGRPNIKIEYLLRNSYQPNERHVKIRSATLKIGGGSTFLRAARPGSISWANVSAGGTTFELVPTTLWKIDTVSNDGMLVADLGYHGATLVADFSEGLSTTEQTNRANAVKSPLFAMAPGSWYSDHGELTTSKFSTLEEEKTAHQKWGWTSWSKYTKEPQDPHKPDYAVSWQAIMSAGGVHGSLESDDLWQNLLMYLRTGSRGYWDRTMAWARYYKWEYAMRTDGFDYQGDSGWMNPRVPRPEIIIPLTTADSDYKKTIKFGSVRTEAGWGGDHLFGWGLIDYYYLTGDLDALEAAKDIGEMSKPIYGWRVPGSYEMSKYSARQGARHLLVLTRLYEATQNSRWKTEMDYLAQLWLQSPDWDPRGFYYSGKNGTDEKFGAGAYDAGVRLTSTFPVGNLSHAFDRYYVLTGNTEIKTRLIAMADWVKNYGLKQGWDYSGSSIGFDYPTPGYVWHNYFEEDPMTGFNPVATAYLIDTLVRGYRLTGKVDYLNRAKYHWDRSSKAKYGVPVTRFAGDTEVGYFVNQSFAGVSGHQYTNDGELWYAHLLFRDYLRSQGGSSPPTDTTAPTISNVTAVSITSSSAVITWTTNEPSDTQVEYGLTTSYGQFTVRNTTLVTSHSQTLTGLTSNKSYHFRVLSRDAASNLATSGDVTFTTLATPTATPTPTPKPTATPTPKPTATPTPKPTATPTPKPTATPTPKPTATPTPKPTATPTPKPTATPTPKPTATPTPKPTATPTPKPTATPTPKPTATPTPKPTATPTPKPTATPTPKPTATLTPSATPPSSTVQWGVPGDIPVPKDYDGDGRADIAVWRPGEANWYFLGRPNTDPYVKIWAIPTDKPVSDDYDGDGRADLGVWRPITGVWFISNSSTPPSARKLGKSLDVTVPGDYDGDGKADIATFKPSTGVWTFLSSGRGNFISKQWGLNGDVPVPGDYNGDKITDLAVWRSTEGNWYILSSSGDSSVTPLGQAGDIPVPKDYDGDGITDMAVFNLSSGEWIIKPSRGGSPIIKKYWGQSGDVPVPADYNGDGKAEIAVWRSTTGVWYIDQSLGNF
jgi:hypothetical protein